MNFTPRPGSSIDKAVKHLQQTGAPVQEAALAVVLECGDEEVRSMLRYGVQEGLLAFEERAGGTWWSLGDRKPGITVGARAPAPAEPLEPRSWPNGYSPQLGGVADRILRYLEVHAPAGSERWALSRDICQALGVDNVSAYMTQAEKRGAVKRSDRNGYIGWQLGVDKRAAAAKPALRSEAVAAPAAPAPALAAKPLHEGERIYSPADVIDQFARAGQELSAMMEADAAAVQKALAVIAPTTAQAAEATPVVDAEAAALERIAQRPFLCGVFSDGRVTIQKGAGQVELAGDEVLQLFEHLAGFVPRREKAAA